MRVIQWQLIVEAAIFLVAVAGMVALLNGCTPRTEQPASLPDYCTVEAKYTKALLSCVEKADTLAESKQCRESVDYSCGIVQNITRSR